jgi:2-oxoglutarate ferredoxin oxidoreductase subunit delta
MSRILFLEERCKGCLLCAAVCPKGIIRQSDRLNRLGYRVAETGEGADQCLGCASCAVMCPDVAIRVFRTKKTQGATPGAMPDPWEARP